MTKRFYAIIVLAVLLTTVGCGAAATPVPLAGPSWRWLEYQDSGSAATSVSSPARYTLYFGNNGKFNLNADCNSGNGAYTTNGSDMTLTITSLTNAVCGAGSLADQYVRDLRQVSSYKLSGSQLVLRLDDGGSMTFGL